MYVERTRWDYFLSAFLSLSSTALFFFSLLSLSFLLFSSLLCDDDLEIVIWTSARKQQVGCFCFFLVTHYVKFARYFNLAVTAYDIE